MDEYTFHIENWLPRFPLQTESTGLVRESGYGPAWICQREELWQRAAQSGDLGSTSPVDTFVLAYGEPGRRDVTKMGGVPYRPAGLNWPRSEKTGHNYGMVAQFRFTESKDILPEIPGDILLCFFEDTIAYRYNDFGERPVFEWYPLGLTDLIAPEDVPESRLKLPPACYGLRYRTVDYADQIAVKSVKDVLPAYYYERWECDETDRHLGCLTHDAGLKIGGIPNWEWPEDAIEENVEPGPFLATIPSLWGDCEDPFPWANRETEVWHDNFKFSQGGLVHLFLDESGHVQPRFDN